MNKKKIITAMISLSLLIQPIMTTNVYANATYTSVKTLKNEMRGQSVVDLQNKLKEVGYFSGNSTGYFGSITQASVKKFQRDHNLVADGIAGRQTFSILNSKNGQTTEVSRGTSSGIYEWTWFKKITNIIPRGTVYKVTDVKTGKQFYVKRTYGTNHADSETLTKEDTNVMKGLYNNRWSWERRPIVVEVNGLKIPASMAGMPHGTHFIRDNNMYGHFDVHFLLSKTHGSNKVDPKHQNAIKIAREFLQGIR
ncbi:peptidoglycan-binding protein [Lutibacter sp. B2]|nr:peptidoglycan-binding protein [Lutibacter sp. B2]